MNNLLSFLDPAFVLAAGPFDYLMLIFNFAAVFILCSALFPPWIEARKKNSTFGLSFTFLYYYIAGGGLMFITSIVNFLTVNVPSDTTTTTCLRVLFGLFIALNILSTYINVDLLARKKRNVKEATARNMTEEEYYNKVTVKETGFVA